MEEALDLSFDRLLMMMMMMMMIAQTCIQIVDNFAENVFQRLENDSIMRVMFCIHIIVL